MITQKYIDQINEYLESGQLEFENRKIQLADNVGKYDPQKYIDQIDWNSICWNINDLINWPVNGYEFNYINKSFYREFFRGVQRVLMQALNDYSEFLGKLYCYYGVSDDGFNDLTAHIIGLGQGELKRVLNNPDLAKERADRGAYEENFLYCFQ
jgi:hypothetical protein